MSLDSRQQLSTQQDGAALMSMLLVVALLSILAAQLIDLSQDAIRSAKRSEQVQQAYWYARAGESFAMSVLAEDAAADAVDAGADSLHDVWAQPFKPFKPAGASLQVAIADLNACFNVNSLAAAGDSTGLRILAGLLSDLSIPMEKLNALQQQIALRPLFSLRELAAELELSAATVDELGSSICVLPSEHSKININTAGKKLLATILGEGPAENIITVRGKQAITSLQQVDLSDNLGASTTLDISSDYFSVYATAQYSGRTRALHTRLFREQTGAVRVLDRQEISPSMAEQVRNLRTQAL